MKFEELTGKKLAMIVWGEDDNGEDDVAVFTGIARWTGEHLYLDREDNPKPFQIPDELLERIEITPEEIKDIVLDAEYYFNATISPLPDNEDESDYMQTGLKWPE